MACSKTHHASLLLLVVALLQLVVVHLAHCSNEPSSNTSRPGGNTMHVRARWQQQEAAALLQLKQSFSFIGPSFCSNSEASDDTTILLPSWRAGNDCCRWEGISCDRVAVRVTALDLSNQHMQIRGFHPALFNLTSLRYLNLEHNEFCGSHLPDFGFDRLTQLQVLNLRESNLSGTIPLSLSGLHSLKTIYLSDNSLTGLIPDIFSNFPLLEILDLAYNPFEHGTLPLGITHLKNLKVLNLQETNLVGVIPNSIGNLSSLTELHLWGNSFIGGLPWSLNNLTRLTLLNCHDSGLSGRIPSFASLTRLEHMWLSNNKLTGPVPLSNGGSIHPNLKIVDLSKNSFSGSGIILASIFTLPSLQYLDLRINSLTGTIPPPRSNMSLSLQHLDLSSNSLSGPIPASIFTQPSLQYLDLSNNSLTGTIPAFRSTMSLSLQHLDLSVNSLSGPIPASIFTQPSLQELYLCKNQLSGSIEEFQKPSAMLSFIDLSSNHLSGTIPSSFSQLTAGGTLVLDSNKFTGVLDLNPLFLSNLDSFSASNNLWLSVSADAGVAKRSNISSLWLASCNLTRLPNAIRHVPKLDMLDLSYNRIRGHIPDWIWRNMSILDLSHNLFSTVGQIPDYTTITDLDLSFNKLRGVVPFPSGSNNVDYSNNKLSSLPSNFLSLFETVIDSINLSNNELRGPLPYAAECHHQNVYLQTLDISSNHLSGSIPPYLLKGCNKLKVLNLRGNRFGGTWPDDMDASCQLILIDLQGNQIQGRLPRSLDNCKQLQDLDVGGNNFTGFFPSWLGNLSYLRLLVLRSNKFYGPVSISPYKMSHSTTRSYFSSLEIIDLAGNGFTGVLPLELFDSFTSMVRSSNRTVGDGQENNNTWHTEDGGSTYTVPIAGLEYSGSPTQYQVAVDVAMKQQYMRVSKIFSDLVVIDLSNNRFSGSIPRTVGNLTSLLVLNMSHNALTGPIPGELGRLAQIESLDLSWNRLTGEIPRQLAALTALEWLNLSHNDLSGSIPSGSQFSTFTSSSFQGGNPGLYGCPLPVRCNLTQPSPGTKVLPPPSPQQQVPDGASADRRFELIVLWLLVGSGYGMGFALAVVLQVVLTRRRKKILARQSV